MLDLLIFYSLISLVIRFVGAKDPSRSIKDRALEVRTPSERLVFVLCWTPVIGDFALAIFGLIKTIGWITEFSEEE